MSALQELASWANETGATVHFNVPTEDGDPAVHVTVRRGMLTASATAGSAEEAAEKVLSLALEIGTSSDGASAQAAPGATPDAQ